MLWGRRRKVALLATLLVCPCSCGCVCIWLWMSSRCGHVGQVCICILPLPPLPCYCLFIFTIFRLLKQLTIKQHFSNWMKRFASSASDMLRCKCAPSELKPVLNGLLHSPSPTSSLVPVSGPAWYKHKRGALAASELAVWKLPRIEWNWHYKFWVFEKYVCMWHLLFLGLFMSFQYQHSLILIH